MLILEKRYKDYLSQEYEPIDESAMPFLVDIRAIKAYADSKGVAIVDLKTSANIHKAWNVADYGYCSFVEYNFILLSDSFGIYI